MSSKWDVQGYSQGKRGSKNPFQKTQTVLKSLQKTHHSTKCRTRNGSTLLESGHPFTQCPKDLERNISASASNDHMFSIRADLGCRLRTFGRLLLLEEAAKGSEPACKRYEIHVDGDAVLAVDSAGKERLAWVGVSFKRSVLTIGVGTGKSILNCCR